MKHFETNCLVVENLSDEQVNEYFYLFGEEGWLDIENVIIKRIDEMSDEEIVKHEKFFQIPNLRWTSYLIVRLFNN
jgi:ferritin-like protein